MARFGAAVTIAGLEAGDGEARHQEGFEDAVLDELDGARGLALVVVDVVAAEGDAVEVLDGGVVDDRHEGGEDGFAEQLGERLAFLVALLALAFEPVAEHLVEEDGAGPAPRSQMRSLSWCALTAWYHMMDVRCGNQR